MSDNSNFKSPTIYFVCNDFERALGLEKVLPNYHIVCIDNNSALIELNKRNINYFCLEKETQTINPIYRNSNRLLQLKETQKYISKNLSINNATLNSKANVIFFKIASNIEQTCKSLDYKILNTTTDLNQAFELKLSQYEKLKDSNVNFPKSFIAKLEEITFQEIIEKLGCPFVIQYDRGHTGSSTVFINNEAELNSEILKFPKRLAKFSKKIEGDAWTLNACVTRFGIVFGGLSYQITGVSECTSKKGGTVGNDWSKTSELKKKTLVQIKAITQNAGNTMQEAGFKGLFGLDFVIDKSGEVFLIEINARQPASTGFHTKLMLKENRITLNSLHLAEFLFENTQEGNLEYIQFINFIRYQNGKDLNLKQIQDISVENLPKILQEQNEMELLPYSASQLIIRNTTSQDITYSGKFTSGIYQFINEKVEKIREGYSIEDITSPENEILILIANKGRVISPEGEIGRIQALRSLLINNSNLDNKPTEKNDKISNKISDSNIYTVDPKVIKIVNQINERDS